MRRSLARFDPDKVRFFVDEDLAGVGLSLMAARNDVVVGSHDPVKDMVPRKDKDWLPVVALYGWVVITNDRKIRTRPHEAPVALEHGLRCVHVAPNTRDANRWDFIRLIAARWDSIELLCDRDGPVWLEVTNHRVRERDYGPQPQRLPPWERESGRAHSTRSAPALSSRGARGRRTSGFRSIRSPTVLRCPRPGAARRGREPDSGGRTRVRGPETTSHR